MFLTITANAALDRVIFIDRYVPGSVMRSTRTIDSVGGKGFDTSVALRAFDVETLAMGFIAGKNGSYLVDLLERYGIEHDLVEVEGETRISHVIVETAIGQMSHIMTPGFSVSPASLDDFFARLERHAPRAKWVLASGSLAKGISSDFYQQVTMAANKAGTSCLVDCAGQSALQAAAAHPTILKMNDDEFRETFNLAADSLDELEAQARRVYNEYLPGTLVITCGKRGILAINPQNSIMAVAPEQIPINPAGAGDAVSAILTWRLAEGDPWDQALRWAAAASAAVVLTEGTADCNRADAERIYQDVEALKR